MVGTMSAQTQWSPQEIAARGRDLGSFISLDILSGDYEVGSSHVETALNLRKRHRDPVIATLRIGYRATFTRNGRMTPGK